MDSGGRKSTSYAAQRLHKRTLSMFVYHAMGETMMNDLKELCRYRTNEDHVLTLPEDGEGHN